MHQRRRGRVQTVPATVQRCVFAAIVAVTLAVGFSSIADDALRALCAAIGQSSPLYDYLGCSALPPLPHSSEG